MNRRTSVLMAALIVLVVGTALAIGLSGSKSAADSCKFGAQTHTVTIQNSKVSQSDVQAKRCDTLTITNKDDVEREVAFGVHDHHIVYDSVSERVLGRGQSLTVTLNKDGTYHWHDHLHDEVEGYFTVAN